MTGKFVGRILACALLFCGVSLGLAGDGALPAAVSVNFAKPISVTSKIGFMGYLTAVAPSDAAIKGSGLKRVRLGATALCQRTEDGEPFDSDALFRRKRIWNPSIIRRVTSLGLEPILIVGSVWNCLYPERFPFDEANGWEAFDDLLRELAPKLKSLGVRFLDVWNEPTNKGYHDLDGNVWSAADLAYATSRVSKILGPSFIIMGPSFDPSAFRETPSSTSVGTARTPGTPCHPHSAVVGKWGLLTEYLDELVCQQGRLDQLSWHPINDELADSMEEDGQYALKNFIGAQKYKSLGFKAPYINFNELIPKSTQFDPAGFLRTYAALERLNVDGGFTSRGKYECEQNPNPNTRNQSKAASLSATIDHKTREALPTYWTQAAYAKNTLSRVQSISNSPQINVLASNQEIWLSNYRWMNPSQQAYHVTVSSNPRALPIFKDSANIELTFYSYVNGLGAVGTPVFLNRVVYPMPRQGDFSFPVLIPWDGTIQITMQPTFDPASPVGLRERPLSFIKYVQVPPLNGAKDSNCSYLSFDSNSGFLLGCNNQGNLAKFFSIGNRVGRCNSVRILMTNGPSDWPLHAKSQVHRDTERAQAPNGEPESDYMSFSIDGESITVAFNDDEDTKRKRDRGYKDMTFTLSISSENTTIQNSGIPCRSLGLAR